MRNTQVFGAMSTDYFGREQINQRLSTDCGMSSSSVLHGEILLPACLGYMVWERASRSVMNRVTSNSRRKMLSIEVLGDGDAVGGIMSGQISSMKSLLLPLGLMGAALSTCGSTCNPQVGQTMKQIGTQSEANRGLVLFAGDVGNLNVFKVSPDGSNAVEIIKDPLDDKFPCFTSYRARVAFLRSGHVFTAWSDGTEEQKITQVGANDSLSCAPDQVTLAFSRDKERNVDIYRIGTDGSREQRLTEHPGIDDAPAWSTDGTRIAFQSDRDGLMHIYVMNEDGTNVKQVTSGRTKDSSPVWADSNRIFYYHEGGDSPAGWRAINADGTDVQDLPIDGRAVQIAPSPDGTKILYSFRDGQTIDLYVGDLGGGKNKLIPYGRPMNRMHPSWGREPPAAPAPSSKVR